MYKDKLQEVLTEKFINDEISTNKYMVMMEVSEVASEKQVKSLLEVTSRSWDEFNFGIFGSKIKVALNQKYKACKAKCIGDNPGRKNYCVEKCRHAYYNALEKNRAKIDKDYVPED